MHKSLSIYEVDGHVQIDRKGISNVETQFEMQVTFAEALNALCTVVISLGSIL